MTRPGRATRGLVVACLAALLLGACAAPAPRRLHFGVDEAPEGPRLMWPQPPEVPRYLYAGELVGEANFRVIGEAPESRLTQAWRWLAGITGESSRPVVLQRPQTGSVDARGRILVADTSRQAVFVFDPVAGALQVWDQAQPGRRFVNPVAVAPVPGGGALVTDATLGVVARLSAAGDPIGHFGAGGLQRPTGLAIDPRDGRVFVADTQAHDIKVFDGAGRWLATWGRRGEAPGEFNYPTHLAWAAGELYVTDTMNHRVQVLDGQTGQARRRVGERGLAVGNLVRPKGVSVDSQGNVYIVESYYDHLLVFDKLGRFLMGIGGVGQGSGRFYLPSGVWTDARDRVFVADTFNGRITIFQFLGGGADGEL